MLVTQARNDVDSFLAFLFGAFELEEEIKINEDMMRELIRHAVESWRMIAVMNAAEEEHG